MRIRDWLRRIDQVHDDVGVDKSIEAGLMVNERFARGKTNRLLVAVPVTVPFLEL